MHHQNSHTYRRNSRTKKLGVIASAMLGLLVTLNAGVMFKGEAKMSKDWKVEILKIKWGPTRPSSKEDRVMGDLKVLREFDDEVIPGCTLVVEFLDRTNGVVRTSSLDIDQKLSTKKGRKNAKKKFEAFYFAFDFKRLEDVVRMRLIDVKYKNESVHYNNFFNVSGTIMRSGMSLPKPKVEPRPLP